jgi:hypothetical protein
LANWWMPVVLVVVESEYWLDKRLDASMPKLIP